LRALLLDHEIIAASERRLAIDWWLSGEPKQAANTARSSRCRPASATWDRVTAWNFPYGPTLSFQHNGDLVTRVTNTVGRYAQLSSYNVSDSESRSMGFSTGGVWTDLTGGQWKYEQAGPVAVSDTTRPIG
jgi:hypothetical protein